MKLAALGLSWLVIYGILALLGLVWTYTTLSAAYKVLEVSEIVERYVWYQLQKIDPRFFEFQAYLEECKQKRKNRSALFALAAFLIFVALVGSCMAALG